MKTKLVNGSRTPSVIYEELKKVGTFEGVVIPRGMALAYHYFTTPQFEGSPAVEVTTNIEGEAVAVRQIDKAALAYLIPDYKKELKFNNTIPPIDSKLFDSKPNDNFTFGGF